ncbi:hypothetical protein [Methyloceanibacter sp.]|uniref:hypothetical protein n=1 Tax=Methyloceanibacter sp. TaxID=1965321 RepID=UPI003D6D51AF
MKQKDEASEQKDDLEAVRRVVEALHGFQPHDQERILRWAREKTGLGAERKPPASPASMPDPPRKDADPQNAARWDIKSFVEAKRPGSDRQFAAVVAYYYKFEAPPSDRKESITKEDLVDATRKSNRSRLAKPGQTLINAHQSGYLDKAADKGAYQINSVGENLVAMALPEGEQRASRKGTTKKRGARQTNKKKTTKKK